MPIEFLEIIPCALFFCVSLASVIGSFSSLFDIFLKYGDVRRTTFHVSKRLFYLFYLIGIITSGINFSSHKSIFNIFQWHCKRRLLESAALLLLPSGNMHLVHLLYGVAYYGFIGTHMNSLPAMITKPYERLTFALLSLFQSLFNCLMLMEKARTGKSYGKIRYPVNAGQKLIAMCELLIHFLLTINGRTLVMIFEFGWVMTYVCLKLSHKLN